MRLIDADKIDFSTVFKGASDFAQDTRNAAQTLIEAQPTVDIKKQIYADLEAHKKLIEDGFGGEYVVELAQIADILGELEMEYKNKEYKLSNGKTISVYYDENDICQLTKECMEILIETQKYCSKDDVTEAVRGLDIFTKNWCKNCAETDKQNDLIFRCSKCEFRNSNEECLVKIFANSKTHNYDMSNFGSMGSH